MVNSKRKGNRWEREASKRLNELLDGGNFKRMPTSGAMGSFLEEPLLLADVQGKVPYINKKLLIEAKVGYGGAKQLTIKKEWFDKLAEDAEKAMALPIVFCKFDNARSGVRKFISMDEKVFAELMNEFNSMYNELCEVYERLAEIESEEE